MPTTYERCRYSETPPLTITSFIVPEPEPARPPSAGTGGLPSRPQVSGCPSGNTQLAAALTATTVSLSLTDLPRIKYVTWTLVEETPTDWLVGRSWKYTVCGVSTQVQVTAILSLPKSASSVGLSWSLQSPIPVSQSKVVQWGVEEEEGSWTSTDRVPRDSVELWWPNGAGAQQLYDLQVTVNSADFWTQHDTATKRVAFRTVQLVQEPLPKVGVEMTPFSINLCNSGTILLLQDKPRANLHEGFQLDPRTCVARAGGSFICIVTIPPGGHGLPL